MKKLIPYFSALFLPFYCFSAPEVTEEVVELLTPKLNSDRIAYFFGSYGVEQIETIGNCRIANLYSLEGDEKIMRTLAIVKFNESMDEALQEVHERILGGESIGIALKKDGWMIEKLPVYFGTVALSPALQSWMHETSSNPAAVHVYNLYVCGEKAKGIIPYCTIIEVHSPQYLDEKWLQALYPDQYPHFQEGFADMSALESLIEHFPNRIAAL